ncbi:MAG: peptidyl-alpha-hydroxyglycine alpha-amidating lyase family protein [Chloroflexota bacterium]
MADPIFGKGKYRFQVVDGFFKCPRDWSYINATDVAVDKDDNVYVFNRSPHPVQIFDKQGNFLDTWGEMGRHFGVPHGITIAPNGDVLTADTRDHTVRRWTKEGKLLLTLGTPYLNAPEQSGEPFNRPTHLAVASNGDYYASDGYGNSHVHCFDPFGKLKFSWGGHGSAPGQFDSPHGIFIDYEDGDKLYVADRENNRIQFFSLKGELLGQWTGLHTPSSVQKGPDGNFYVSELTHRISILDKKGVLLARWGDEVADECVDDRPVGGGLPTSPARNPMLRGRVVKEPGPGMFGTPHGMAVDSEGSFYVGEVCDQSRMDRGNRNVQKFVRVR